MHSSLLFSFRVVFYTLLFYTTFSVARNFDGSWSDVLQFSYAEALEAFLDRLPI